MSAALTADEAHVLDIIASMDRRSAWVRCTDSADLEDAYAALRARGIIDDDGEVTALADERASAKGAA